MRPIHFYYRGRHVKKEVAFDALYAHVKEGYIPYVEAMTLWHNATYVPTPNYKNRALFELITGYEIKEV